MLVFPPALAAALLIALTLTLGWLVDGKAPFFPIDLSRILATCTLARRVFVLGLLSLLPFVLARDRYLLAAWLCVCGVVVWDDVAHYRLHMACVCGVIAALALRAHGDPAKTAMIGVAVGLIVARTCAKAWAVFVLEGGPWQRVVLDAQAIMYTGVTRHPLTLAVFRAGGLVQWLAFALLLATV